MHPKLSFNSIFTVLASLSVSALPSCGGAAPEPETPVEAEGQTPVSATEVPAAAEPAEPPAGVAEIPEAPASGTEGEAPQEASDTAPAAASPAPAEPGAAKKPAKKPGAAAACGEGTCS